MKKTANTIYRSYLLRFWQDSPQARWYASVQSVQDKETIHFVCMEDLIAFLWGQATCEQEEREMVNREQ